MLAKHFEDLIAWQKARNLTKRIYDVTKHGDFAKDYRLVAQMRAASVSVMSNLAEGFERYSRSEFHQGIVHAKGSCGELRAQLYVAMDAEYISEDLFLQLRGDAAEVSRLLEGLRADLYRKKSSAS